MGAEWMHTLGYGRLDEEEVMPDKRGTEVIFEKAVTMSTSDGTAHRARVRRWSDGHVQIVLQDHRGEEASWETVGSIFGTANMMGDLSHAIGEALTFEPADEPLSDDDDDDADPS